MTELNARQLSWLAHDVLDETCETHGCQIWQKKIPGREIALTFCPECQKAETEAVNRELVARIWRDSERQRKYGMLERESIINPELRQATFDSYRPVTPADQEGLDFAKRVTRHYYEGGKGNVVLSGHPGIGKSHLSLSMLRALNEAGAKKEQYATAIFMPVARLFSLITDSFNSTNGMTEARAVELLTACDYLVLDDLGKESSYSHELKRANDWKQSVLFQILDNRERTIITTNFSPEKLAYIYDPALYDRILKGDESLKMRFDDTMISKR